MRTNRTKIPQQAQGLDWPSQPPQSLLATVASHIQAMMRVKKVAG